MTDVAVVGGGISGLCAAWQLSQFGIPFTLYESSGRLGGMIGTDRRDGYLLERGPSTLLATSPKVTNLVTTLRLVFPMFPHYAMSSYESAVVSVRETAAEWHPQLEVSVVPPYYDAPGYIDSLVHAARPQLSTMPDHLLFSFHGMPIRHLRKAGREPHTCYCHQSIVTMRGFLKRSGWPQERAGIAYQSRLGPDRWLEPHTHIGLERLARSGVRRLAVICPSFTVDCLETLEEIAIRGRDVFLHAGGEEFTMIPALNDGAKWVRAIANMLSRERAFDLALTWRR